MVSPSVGEVSGFIAAGVFVFQLALPLGFAAGLIAFISEENSVATWSALGRYLQSSRWPILLNTDSASDKGVQPRVVIASWLPTVALFLITVASIVTPLGLHDLIEPSEQTIDQPFSYISDDSVFGPGTPPRPDGPFSRVCGTEVACPGGWIDRTCRKQGRGENCTVEYESRIPKDYIDVFRNGATKAGPSVSSIFDIQWRSYVNATDPYSVLGWYVGSAFRQLSILILEEKIKLVEGLIVDMETGGVGFRNHTAPKHTFEYGSTWKEDILFVQPETECVNMNITIDFKLPLDNTGYQGDLVLTDRGGFSALPRTSPSLDPFPNGQGGLNLKERAYKAAWVNNYLTMVYYNATNPDPQEIKRLDVKDGDTFSIPRYLENTTFSAGHRSIRSSIRFGEYLNIRGTSNRNQSIENGTNPFDVNRKDFSVIEKMCVGSTVDDRYNINSSVVGCSLLYGAAERTDGKSPLLSDPGSPWSIPMYSCASSVKATIREVTLQYNGTGIEALKVKKAEPKSYPDSSNMPLWGVENMTTTNVQGALPGWGVLGPTNEAKDEYPYNITTISKESLYLPGFLGWSSAVLDGLGPVPVNIGQNFPGAEFYTQALAMALAIERPNTKGFQYTDYSGQSSVALYAKWQKLSKKADDAAKILNLVWTDVSANTVVGTKGWGLDPPASITDFTVEAPKRLKKRASDDEETPPNMVAITIYEQQIGFKMVYGIPAFIVLGISIITLGAVLYLFAARKTGIKKLRKFLELTSTGRIIGVALWPEKGRLAGSKEWLDGVLPKRVRITPEGLFEEKHHLTLTHAVTSSKSGSDVALNLLGRKNT